MANILLSSKWDLTTQTPHGGQEWRDLSNFVEDFSVTTNALGTPEKAKSAARSAIDTIEHYPPSDCDPAWTSLANFLLGADASSDEIATLKSKLLLGNGASELIDLCIRLTPGSKWRPGPSKSQYMEYERSATSYGKKKSSTDDVTAELLCIVNPCNPTGDFMGICEMKHFIEKYCTCPGSTIIVDESMQPWFGKDWRKESLVSQQDWITNMAVEKDVKIFLMHSWTKLWCCTGLRIGSLLAPTAADGSRIRKTQVPWSLNSMAVAFLDEVTKDHEYLEQTWDVTSKWRDLMCTQLKILHPDWDFCGHKFLSFVWIDTKSEKTAAQCVENAAKFGVPIRWGKHGYNEPTFIRLGVRKPDHLTVLLQALRTCGSDLMSNI